MIKHYLQSRQYLSAKEVCLMIGIHRQTLWRWRQNGMPYHRPYGKSVLFIREEVEEWIKNLPK